MRSPSLESLQAHDESLTEEIARFVYLGRDRSHLIAERTRIRAEIRNHPDSIPTPERTAR